MGRPKSKVQEAYSTEPTTNEATWMDSPHPQLPQSYLGQEEGKQSELLPPVVLFPTPHPTFPSI